MKPIPRTFVWSVSKAPYALVDRRHVHGLELVEAAVHDAENNATRNGIHNATFKQENLDLTKISPHELDLPKSDVIVLDPPRAGLHPRLVK